MPLASFDPSALPGVPLAWAMTFLAEGGGTFDFLMPILIVGVIFWLLVFRPASRERKQREQQVRALGKHDKVVTNAGIHGIVTGFDDETVTLRIDDKNNVRVKFSRTAIWQVLSAEAEAK